ncbi:MAG: hypothetical protein J4215_01535 [Candidatus Diapherotrites archaeon]|uniref:Uncharacterized protein n=1 Tax=Candidatus Iainarchaeum sp. TaxID=3101447 RepID=A0A8T4LEC1_9ARCH|nr:hypothetical protein [Candidatus Diapherotrites archaeon]
MPATRTALNRNHVPLGRRIKHATRVTTRAAKSWSRSKAAEYWSAQAIRSQLKEWKKTGLEYSFHNVRLRFRPSVLVNPKKRAVFKRRINELLRLRAMINRFEDARAGKNPDHWLSVDHAGHLERFRTIVRELNEL